MYSRMLLCVAYFLVVNLAYNVINARISYSQLRDYVYISSDVKNHLQSSSVLNVYNDKNSDATTMSTMFEISRAFSKNNIFALSLKLSEVKKYFAYNKNQTSLPLYTVTLNSQKDLDEFSKFAQNFSMSFNVWLIFFGESVDLLQFCKFPHKNLFNLTLDTRMLIKCENEDVIREWYSLFNDKVKVYDVATWTRENRFIKTNNQFMWKNRNSLDGIRIRVATVKRDDYISNGDYFKNTNNTLSGMFGNVFHELSFVMNFTIDVVGSEQMFGHYYGRSKNWSGVMGCLGSKVIDIGVAEFSRNKRRLQVADFSVPLLTTRFNMYVKRPNITAITWSSYVQIFNRRIWATNIFLMTFCSLVIAIMMSKLGKKDLLALISENCFYIWGMQCQQGLPEFPSATSLKLAFASLFISSIVIHITYSATLTSFITIYEPILPFTSENEFLTHSSYNLTVLRGSIYHDSIEQSKHPVVKLMRQRLVNAKDIPTNMVEALRQICSQKVVLYVNEIFVNTDSPRNPCPLMSIDIGRPDSQSFALIKHSPYTKMIDFHIENFRCFGILKAIRNRHQQKMITLNSKYWPVSFWSIVPILIIFISGVFFAILMLICEHVHFFMITRNKLTPLNIQFIKK